MTFLWLFLAALSHGDCFHTYKIGQIPPVRPGAAFSIYQQSSKSKTATTKKGLWDIHVFWVYVTN